MADAGRLLVITQPILGPISAEDIGRAIPATKRPGSWDLREIAPVRTSLGDLREIDWAGCVAEQERLFAERLREEMPRRNRLAYFGLAPLPLAVHLGYRVERTRPIDVYQRHHQREDWRWPRTGTSRAPLLPLALPERGSQEVGPVVIRVSTSHRIDPRLTVEVVPRALADVDVGLVDPHEDALATPRLLGEVVRSFHQALVRMNRLFPRVTDIHLFMAVPVGLAFRMGTQVNPTIFLPIVTYQFQAKAGPRYRAAVVLTDGIALASAPFAQLGAVLNLDEMRNLQEAVIRCELARCREELLAGVDRGFVASLRMGSSLGGQIWLDLDTLCQAGALRGGSFPLVCWLENAAMLARPRPEAAVFESALAKLRSAS